MTLKIDVDLIGTLTVKEFEKLPEFGDRYELIDGRLVKESVPGGEHSYIIDLIRDAIKFFDPERRLGYSLQETSVRVGPESAPTPDISYWKAGRQVKITKQAMPLPDLAVEIHSPGDLQSNSALRKAMLKVKKLLDAGVTLVWAIYPDQQTVEVYQADQGYAAGPVETLGVGDELSGGDVIPGFRLPVKDLFE